MRPDRERSGVPHMIFQKNSYSCGPCAIVNACLALGHAHDVDDVARLAGTTSRGTDEKGIMSALDALGYSAMELNAPGDVEKLRTYVTTALSSGDPVIICVDRIDHWIAAIGLIRDRIVTFDSEDSTENHAVNGVRIYDEKSFRERLGGSRYAIRVSDRVEESSQFDVARSLGLKSPETRTENVAGFPDELVDIILGRR